MSDLPKPFAKPRSISAAEFEDYEIKALDGLCEQFRSRENHAVTIKTLTTILGLEDEKLVRRVFKRLEGIGAIEERESVGVGFTGHANRTYDAINPQIFDIAAYRKREIKDHREPTDRVAALERWARSNRLLSIALITLIVLTFLVTFINQLVQLIDWAVKNWG